MLRQNNSYKGLINNYQIIAGIFYNFLVVCLVLSACSKTSPKFQADKQLEDKLNQIKPLLSELIKICKALKPWSSGREIRTRDNELSTCPIGEGYLKMAGIQEVAQNSKKLNYIFMTDLDNQSYAATFIQEKGYAYFSQPPSSGVIQSGTLDQFLNKDLFQRQGIQEEWRYKKIEGNWYLYYRQYYETFLP